MRNFRLNFQKLYYYGLILLAIALPLSIFLLSVAQIILLINWLLEGKFIEKWRNIASRKSILAFLIIYGVHLIGIFYSSDLTYGLHDLQIKLPLLILPIIIGTSLPLGQKQFYHLLLFFSIAVFISTIISTGKLFSWWGDPVSDIRDISIFISHIRLALMINLAIFSIAWFFQLPKPKYQNILLGLLLVWFVLFLFLLKSLTGIIVFAIITIFLLSKWTIKLQGLIPKWFLGLGIITVLLVSMTYLTHSISRFYTMENLESVELDAVTINGNQYSHNVNSKDFENGNYTWNYVCEQELLTAWNQRSKLDYRGTDLKGQELKYTLIRYLTSKGLRKDEAGVKMLSDIDIQNIENGIANHIFTQKFSFYPRIYQLLWEINQYKNGGNPSGHSSTQRIVYLQTGIHIIKDNFWFGVGTGDVAKAFHMQYEKDHSSLAPRWQLRAHNQFITFFIAFGIVGLFIILVSLVYPIYKEQKWNSYFMIVFLLTGFISFLNEDTLETHAGISFFAFFFALFLFTPTPTKE